MITPPYCSSHAHVRSRNALAEVVAGQAFLRELPLDHVLRRDPRVVVPRLPEAGRRASGASGSRVLDRRIERVPHVQLARDVGRRERDRAWLAREVDVGVVEAFGLPCLLPARLDALRPVEGSMDRPVRSGSDYATRYSRIPLARSSPSGRSVFSARARRVRAAPPAPSGTGSPGSRRPARGCPTGRGSRARAGRWPATPRVS